MASFSLTVEDSSPLFVYDPPGAWSDSSLDDPLLNSYSGQSYHTTSQQGATATIEFYGSGLTILGGKRPQYGRFSVSVDGAMVVTNGSARGHSNATRQTLATISRLRLGKHRAMIENVDGAPIDVDSVVIIDEVGSPGAEMEAKILDDSDPRLAYAPSSNAWGRNSLPIFQGGTIRFSQNPEAAVALPFEGDAIAIYGTVPPDHADMKVTINGEVSLINGGSNGGVNRLHPQVLLFYRSGLGPGTHNLNFAVDSPNPDAPFIDLDSMIVLSATSPSVSTARTPTEVATTVRASATAAGRETGPTVKGGKISKDALAGVIVAGAAGLLICLGLFFAWRRRRERITRGSNDQERNNGGLSSLGLFRRSGLPMQQQPRVKGMVISGPLENSIFAFPPKPTFDSFPARRAADARHSIAPSYYGSPESGRTLMSLGSTSSATPLIRPPASATRKVARNFSAADGVPLVPGPPLPDYSPSISSTLSRGWGTSGGPSPALTRPRNPPLPF